MKIENIQIIKQNYSTYHEIDDACTFTIQDNEIVLPFFTCNSCEPIIFARAAVRGKLETKRILIVEIKQQHSGKKSFRGSQLEKFQPSATNLHLMNSFFVCHFELC